MVLGPISIGEKLKSITSDVLNGSKKFKQDIDYRKRSKHHAVHLEGAANFTVNLNLK